jgi:bifunctional non-homologous end joining protein LigD
MCIAELSDSDGGLGMATKKKIVRKTAAKRPAAKKAKRASGTASSRSTKSVPLADYKRKRDFTKTAEPAGKDVRTTSARKLHFVVQKHAASHLHFDFRLELDGVMKSWAVPKGPSYDPSVRRLAMEVEDHPIEYNTFEGTIPKGQYGGGTVMLWDRGTYEAEGGGGEDELREGHERGDLKITMHGKRLLGGWVLVRIRGGGERAQWLLIKHRDEYASTKLDVVAAAETSVATGRSMEEIANPKGRGRVWNSNRASDGDAEADDEVRTPKASARKSVKPRKTSAAASRKKPASPRRRRSTRSTS